MLPCASVVEYPEGATAGILERLTDRLGQCDGRQQHQHDDDEARHSAPDGRGGMQIGPQDFTVNGKQPLDLNDPMRRHTLPPHQARQADAQRLRQLIVAASRIDRQPQPIITNRFRGLHVAAPFIAALRAGAGSSSSLVRYASTASRSQL